MSTTPRDAKGFPLSVGLPVRLLGDDATDKSHIYKIDSFEGELVKLLDETEQKLDENGKLAFDVDGKPVYVTPAPSRVVLLNRVKHAG